MGFISRIVFLQDVANEQAGVLFEKLITKSSKAAHWKEF